MTNSPLPPQAASSFAAERGPSLSAQPTPSLPLEERPVIGGKPAWRVYRLSPGGRRVAEVPCAVSPSESSRSLSESKCDGTSTIAFTARTDYDPASATYLYEIVRE